MRIFSFLVVTFVLIGLIAQLSNVDATPATPAAEVLPDVVCEVPPRSIEEIEFILRTGASLAPDEATPEITVLYQRPEGNAWDHIPNGIEWTVRQFVACTNSGDILRYLGLFTPNYLREHRYSVGNELADEQALLTPSPVPDEERTVIASIEDVVLFGDGSFNALVNFAAANDRSKIFSLQVLFVYDGSGPFLIEEMKPVSTSAELTGWPSVKGSGYEGVIVPRDRAPEFSGFIRTHEIQGVWTPTEDDIRNLEINLQSYLKRPKARADAQLSDGFADRLPSYKRQYVGFVLDSQLFILVNATCMDDFNWHYQPVLVLGGGECFFHVVFNPASGSFTDFEVNAPI